MSRFRDAGCQKIPHMVGGQNHLHLSLISITRCPSEEMGLPDLGNNDSWKSSQIMSLDA
jgi:hypothetical protein